MKTALKVLIAFIYLNIFSVSAQQVDWAKKFSEDKDITVRAVDIDSQGNVYLMGITDNPSTDLDPGSGVFNLANNLSHDVFLVKLDSEGNFLWGAGTYTNYEIGYTAMEMEIGDDGFIYTLNAISISDGGFSQSAALINKYDGAGNLILTKTVKKLQTDNNSEYLNVINFDIDSNGNIYLNGHFLKPIVLDLQNPQVNISYTGAGSFIIKISNSGEYVWTKTFNVQAENYSEVLVRPDNDLIFLMRKTVQNQTQTGYDAVQMLYKIDDLDGNIIWEKSFYKQSPNDFTLAPNGEIVISSYFENDSIDVDPTDGNHIITPPDTYENQYILWLTSEGEFMDIVVYYDTWTDFMQRSIYVDENYNCYIKMLMPYEGTFDIDPSENEFFTTNSYYSENSLVVRFDSNHNFVTGYNFGENTSGFYVGQVKFFQDKLYFTGSFRSTVDIQAGPDTYFLEKTWYTGSEGYVFVLGDCTLTAPDGDTDQYFCQGQSSKISDLKPNAQNIAWYDSDTSTTPLASTTSLIDGQIYYAARITNCGIPDRLAVTAHINAVPAAPISLNQQFCKSANPTIANLTATGTDIKWYADDTSTTPIESATLLINGQYYASQTTNGCESQRTAITVALITTPAPTAAALQAFCINSNATVTNLTVTGTDIKVYDSNTSTTPLDGATPLQNLSYYATQTLNGCESDRIAIAVTINNPSAPTAALTQVFCAGDLPVINNIIVTGINIKWYDAATGGNIIPGNIALTDNTTYYASQTINGCESISRCVITVTIDSANIPAQNYQASFCDSNNDGREIVNLHDYNSHLLPSPAGYDFTYYYSENGAQNKLTSDKINNPENLPVSTGSTTVFVRIESPGGCFKIVSLTLEVAQPTPSILPESEYYICQGNSLTIVPNAGFTNFIWSNGSKKNTFTINQPGNYSVTADYSHGTITCKTTFSFTVTALPETHITKVLTADWTDNDNAITIITSPGNDNEYSIDGIHYQHDNHFNNLVPGIYTIHARDINGCGYDTSEVLLLNYPKFFTPNNDGVNDYWKIENSFFEKDLNVIIFDRYGKIIKGFKNNESGWDGTLDNKPLPATDYWFVVKRAGKEYKGHFSLIR